MMHEININDKSVLNIYLKSLLGIKLEHNFK